LNAEFQRIARRDKRAFLSDQCKEIEENNKIGKTRGLFKKIRDTKDTSLVRTSVKCLYLGPIFIVTRLPQTCRDREEDA